MEEVRIYFREIINALEYCHFHGISHRDLKLENVLLSDNKIVKFGDFGLSDEMENVGYLFLSNKKGKMMNLACGSIQYAAPEILKRERYMGEMVDIWSVGIMLFGLVNSYLPFEDDGQGLSSVLRKIQLNDYVFKNGLSPEIKDLLTKMLNVRNINKSNNNRWILKTELPLVKLNLIPGFMIMNFFCIWIISKWLKVKKIHHVEQNR